MIHCWNARASARRRSVHLVAGLLAAACLAAVPAHARPATWQRASTPHFVLYVRADRDSALRLARSLESMADLLAREGFGTRASARPRVTLIGFPETRDFQSHLPVRDGKRAEFAGLAQHLPFGTWIGFAADDPRGRLVAHHELLHTIVSLALGNAPLCMNEGLAEYYSTWEANERGGRFGHPIPWHVWVVRNRQPFTLDELFATTVDSPLYGAGAESQTMFYAESWALTHYLGRLSGRSKRYRQLALLIAGGRSPRDAFKEVYPGESWEAMPEKLTAYVRGETLGPQEISFASPLAALPVEVREASPAEVAAHIGMWRVYDVNVTSAVTRALFEQARAGNDEPGLATAGLGLFELREQNAPEALADFRSVAATPNACALALALAGGGLLTRSLEDSAGVDSAQARALAAEACAALRRSVALDSTDANALAWYGRAALSADSLSPGAMHALEVAAAALPVDGPVASTWAAALSQTGQRQRAREVFSTHAGLTQDKDLRAATSATLAFDAFQDSVDALAKAGDYPALERLLDRTEATTHDRELLAAIASLRRQMAAAMAQQHWVDLYNDGIRAVRAGEYAKAQTLFTTARDSSLNDKLSGEATARLSDLAGVLEFERGMKAYRKKDYATAAAAFERARDLATTDDLRAQATKNAEVMRKAAAAAARPAAPAPRRK
jgi:tetratricopeptide (TPR) repeat protein